MRTTAKPHGRRYPWDEILPKALKGPVVLTRGVDFDGEPLGMAQSFRQAAVRYGYTSAAYVQSAVIRGDTLTLRLRGKRAA